MWLGSVGVELGTWWFQLLVSQAVIVSIYLSTSNCVLFCPCIEAVEHVQRMNSCLSMK